jgi:ABC-2 type transport system ATP-binding protein
MDIRKSFRSEIYEAELAGMVNGNINLPPTCRIIDSSVSTDRTIIKIQGFMDNKPNELLTQLIRQAEVHAFREILPTMNDIFIATVNAAEK